MLKKNKTTPQNVKEAHEALFHAKMNLPDAADHCGMTQKELKMTFFEYLKYNAPNTQVTENTTSIPRREKQGTSKPVPIPPRPCLLYTSPSPRDKRQSRMPSSA